MQKELKEAFRLYDKEGKHAFFSLLAQRRIEILIKASGRGLCGIKASGRRSSFASRCVRTWRSRATLQVSLWFAGRINCVTLLPAGCNYSPLKQLCNASSVHRLNAGVGSAHIQCAPQFDWPLASAKAILYWTAVQSRAPIEIQQNSSKAITGMVQIKTVYMDDPLALNLRRVLRCKWMLEKVREARAHVLALI